ncbi:hypothetical protein VaNZ11_000582 [Volvox africanus]|uniref:RING-type E3 ubiquitin transferase n=1 Tax=Volvox africanus TaxID=51714 RepID=A0ABQ5RNC9_9CHLO|nr:hypothetical protein VaNZ11_000582 [Volvox africanus]
MLRGFATARSTSMDQENGLGIAHGPNRRTSIQRRLDVGASHLSNQATAASSFGRAILFFCLALLVLGVLPAMFAFWACIIVLIFTCLRLRLQAQHVHQALELDDLGRRGASSLHLGTPGGPVLRVIPGAGLLLLHADPHAVLQRINVQLRHLDNIDEEMGVTESDLPFAHSPFSAATAGAGNFGARPPPVSDADIAALPCYTYKLPRGAAAASACGAAAVDASTTIFASPVAAAAGAAAAEGCAARSPIPQASSPASLQVASSSGAGGQPTPGLGRLSSGCAAAAAGATGGELVRARAIGGSDGGAVGPAGLTCPVCLDAVAEGSTVMTLPCLHQFHASCVTPWLRQQGIYATCPMCKTPVFQ